MVNGGRPVSVMVVPSTVPGFDTGSIQSPAPYAASSYTASRATFGSAMLNTPPAFTVTLVAAENAT